MRHPVPLEVAHEVVAVVQRLVERVSHALALAVTYAVRGAPAFDQAALDPPAEDRALGLAENEVDLAVQRPLTPGALAK